MPDTTTYGHAFSPEVIAASPPLLVDPSLLPWLRKDRREAETGAFRTAIDKDGKQTTSHDRQGLEHAQKEARRIERDLAAAIPGSNRAAILAIQQVQAACAVQFWQGKMALLDRAIAAAEKAS